MTTPRKTLEEYLAFEYPFNVVADREGGYVILYPDLPGCMTQVERLEEVPEAAEGIRRLWIETEYAEGAEVPLPSYPEEYSGKFNLRLPKSLHRELAEAAERDGVSLNQYVVMLLSRREAEARVERRLDGVEAVQPPAEYVERAGEGAVVVSRAGRPVAVVLAVEDADLKTISLSTNPKFLALIERSRSRLAEEGGLTEDEVRRRLGMPVGGARRTEDTEHTRKTRKGNRR